MALCDGQKGLIHLFLSIMLLTGTDLSTLGWFSHVLLNSGRMSKINLSNFTNGIALLYIIDNKIQYLPFLPDKIYHSIWLKIDDNLEAI